MAGLLACGHPTRDLPISAPNSKLIQWYSRSSHLQLRGQLRNFTGFPFKSNDTIACSETIYWNRMELSIYILWW